MQSHSLNSNIAGRMIKLFLLLTSIQQLCSLSLFLPIEVEAGAAAFQLSHSSSFHSTQKIQHKKRYNNIMVSLTNKSFSRLNLSSPNKSNSDDKNKGKRGYQFGDITKSLINKITNKDEYEFGDLSRHLDSKVKERLAEINDKNNYEFGDLTRYLVKDFTNSTNYQFGDITKEIIRRVKTNNYTMEDLALLVKALVSFGVGLTPVASFLPMKLLIEMLNYSIAGDLGTKVASSISLEIDKRMKDALVGDENYKVGDLTKKAILKYTGREDYAFGDITKTVVESLDEYDKQQQEIALLNQKLKDAKEGMDANSGEDKAKRPSPFLSSDSDYDGIANELKAWDDKYLRDLTKNETKE